MLKAFYQQLRHMAANTEDHFHRHVVKRIGAEGATAELESALKDAILTMPQLTSRISSLWGNLRHHSRIKSLGSYFMTYMYNPHDFIPEDEDHGLFGYVDDAYFVCAVYDLLIEELIKMKIPLSEEDLQLRENAVRHKAQIKAVIAPEASEIQRIIGEALDGEDETFSALFQKE